MREVIRTGRGARVVVRGASAGRVGLHVAEPNGPAAGVQLEQVEAEQLAVVLMQGAWLTGAVAAHLDDAAKGRLVLALGGAFSRPQARAMGVPYRRGTGR